MTRYLQRKVSDNVYLPVAMKFLISWLALLQCGTVVLLSKEGYHSMQNALISP